LSLISKSWQAFSPEIARIYLDGYGGPAESSKELLLNILKSNQAVSILDLGCGNAQLYEYFKSQNYICKYTGIDFSEPLLAAARNKHPEAEFIADDVHKLDALSGRNFDFVIYSHVLEMLESPHASLLQAKEYSSRIAIRFFEPPEAEVDRVELLEMEGGKGLVPYLRRTMSKKYYQLILHQIGCKRVDIYLDISKDQVHVLRF
jgi:ubiquinone/menaquinone biosynthesis C-methylase UbiE